MKIMDKNAEMYKKFAKKRMTAKRYLEFETEMDLAYAREFVPCSGYEELTSRERDYFGMGAHNRYYAVYVRMISQLDVAFTEEQTVLSQEADTLLKVAVMRQHFECASIDPVSDVLCQMCNTKHCNGVSCPTIEVPLPVIMSPPLTTTISDNVGHASVINYSVTSVQSTDGISRISELNGFGVNIHNLIDSYGDQCPKINSLMRGGITNREVTKILNDGHVLVRHREFIGTVDLSKKRSEMAVKLGPGQGSHFSWLSRVSSRYKHFLIKGLVFDYVPVVSSFNNAKLTMASFQPEASTTDISLLSNCVEHSASSSWIYPVECYRPPRNRPYLVDKADFNMTNIGLFVLRSQGVVAEFGQLGELWASYEIELWGDYRVPSCNDTTHGYVKSVLKLLGPEFAILRYLFSRLGIKHNKRASVYWLDSNHNTVKENEFANLVIKLHEPMFESFRVVVPRIFDGVERDSKYMILFGMACVAASWSINAAKVSRVRCDPLSYVVLIQDQVKGATLSFNLDNDVARRLSSVGVVPKNVQTYVNDVDAYVAKVNVASELCGDDVIAHIDSSSDDVESLGTSTKVPHQVIVNRLADYCDSSGRAWADGF